MGIDLVCCFRLKLFINFAFHHSVSNAFTDRLKQDAMNLFLGFYIPSRHTVPLWDLESDY